MFLYMMIIVANFVRDRNEPVKWFISVLSVGCLAILVSYILPDDILPAVSPYLSPRTVEFLRGLKPLSDFAGYTYTPYGTLMFAITYSGPVARRTKRTLAFALLAPIVYMLFTTPLTVEDGMNYAFFGSWALLYHMVSAYFLVRATVNEPSKANRVQKILVTFLILSPEFFNILFNIFPRAFHASGNWRAFFTPFAAAALVFTGYSVYRYGVFGIRIRFEKHVFNNTFEALARNRGAMNHLMKNRLTNMTILARKVKEEAANPDRPNIVRDLDLMVEEMDRLNRMIARMQKQLEEVTLDKKPNRLADVIELAIRSNDGFIHSKGVTVRFEESADLTLPCDSLHLQEALGNMIRNAIEAMKPGEGVLTIRIVKKTRSVDLLLKDNGTGIAKKEQARIFDPFYSTKHGEHNFGLGLPYARMVAQKHGGDLLVNSEEGQGTEFTLRLPLDTARWNGKFASKRALRQTQG
ncbi:sensor histidine kinase [Cohnella caldifontis]|uniref:sensor histidine kinase n=1 Tax=Cohnella caldifontis TaxID=3027471 RepID=UPI0023ED36B7|nr:sensor histidine kinase [Cohnella sp. YIM B05605]